jgi:uncharacterized OB-fold protein
MKDSIPLTWRRIPERYRLLGAKCETCGAVYFPRRSICPKCRRKGKLSETQFSGKGVVFSFTEVTAPPEGFEDQVPYILAVIELDEGARLTAQIVDASKDDVKLGSRVEQVFRVIQRNDPEGLIHYGFKFRLAE